MTDQSMALAYKQPNARFDNFSINYSFIHKFIKLLRQIHFVYYFVKIFHL